MSQTLPLREIRHPLATGAQLMYVPRTRTGRRIPFKATPAPAVAGPCFGRVALLHVFISSAKQNTLPGKELAVSVKQGSNLGRLATAARRVMPGSTRLRKATGRAKIVPQDLQRAPGAHSVHAQRIHFGRCRTELAPASPVLSTPLRLRAAPLPPTAAA